jgi:hypothetical protein
MKHALFALLASIAWALFTFTKVGSASNYWMEPCVAALVAFARAPVAFAPARFASVLPAIALAQVTWIGVASVRATIERIPEAIARSNALPDLRARCATNGRVAISENAGLQWDLDGRVVFAPAQLRYAAEAGRFDDRALLADLARPEMACVVTTSDILEEDPARALGAEDPFGARVRAAIRERFWRDREIAGYRVYIPRAR